ncbi:MAG TPA: hypothetical protein VHR66_09095 [Gemmataceae bacterium]|jgi:uncharacterized protein (DUF983 family)|nr:hypothetical protein [Gemmataceae bacterium]
MTDGASVNSCPRCGSDWLAGGALQTIRTCRDCGLRFLPPTPRWERKLVALVLIVPSLIGLIIAGFGIALAVNAPPKDEGAVIAGLACGAVFGVASIMGMVLGVREWRVRRQNATVIPDADERPPSPALPADRAIEIAHAIAHEHRATHIAKQINNITPRRVATARARFAQAMTDDETPLVMVDTTMLRRGGAGFLITNRAFYSSHMPMPINLADMRQIVHRPPDKQTQVMLHVVVGLTHFFPPAAILMVFLMFGRRHRFRHVLTINDRIVHVAQKPMTWPFWVDLLVALSSELQPASVDRSDMLLEVYSSDPAVEPVSIAEPPTEAIDRAIRSLNGTSLNTVRLWNDAERTGGLEIVAGENVYYWRELPNGEAEAYADVEAVIARALQFNDR